jgi:fructoselysine-6-P-deglycase FrlB-like protein
MRDLETFLHGHLPAEGEQTGLVLVACDRRGGERHRQRAQTLLRAAARIGIRCAVVSTHGWEGLAQAGELPAPRAGGLPAAAAALLGAAAPLQLLALELALARGTNPDLIRRDEEAYREAARIVEGD